MIIGNAKLAMRMGREELFGAVIATVSVAGEEEAVQVADSTGYGSPFAIFTEDLNHGLRSAKR